MDFTTPVGVLPVVTMMSPPVHFPSKISQPLLGQDYLAQPSLPLAMPHSEAVLAENQSMSYPSTGISQAPESHNLTQCQARQSFAESAHEVDFYISFTQAGLKVEISEMSLLM